MSTSPATKSRITDSSASAGICPCATPTRARGASDAHPGRDRLDGLDPVVHHEHLAAAVGLPGERLLQQRVVPRLHERQDGGTVARRGLDQREVAEAGEGEVERAGNRRGGEGEHVHREPERLEPLLVLHAEAMLLVHDEQAEVLERRRPSRAGGGCRSRCRSGPRPAGRAPPSAPSAVRKRDSTSTESGKVGQPLEEGAPVLLRQNRRRHQHRRPACRPAPP